jgi:hypothetical protein
MRQLRMLFVAIKYNYGLQTYAVIMPTARELDQM